MDEYDLWDLEDDGWGKRPWPGMDHTGGRKPSQYHPAIGREIVRGVLEGHTVREIAAWEDMPSYATIFHWLKKQDDFAWRYQAARRGLARGKVQARESRRKAKAFWPKHRAAIYGGRWWVSGRRSTYEREVAMAFCERIRRGETVTSICARKGMPSQKALYAWLRREPEFRAAYVAARDEWLEILQDRAMAVEYRILSLHSVPAIRAVQKEADRLWGEIGRRTAKTYRTGCV
jgi:hypothetical protein